jgi:hypothetical protein
MVSPLQPNPEPMLFLERYMKLKSKEKRKEMVFTETRQSDDTKNCIELHCSFKETLLLVNELTITDKTHSSTRKTTVIVKFSLFEYLISSVFC